MGVYDHPYSPADLKLLLCAVAGTGNLSHAATLATYVVLVVRGTEHCSWTFGCNTGPPNRVSNQLVSTVEHLADKKQDNSLKSWWKATQSQKECEYWTYIHQVDTNTSPNADFPQK